MNTYIVLLRGINVSGKNIIKMAVLKEILTGEGFGNVVTYIQSGNIVLESGKERDEVGQKIRKLISDHFGWDIRVFVLTLQQVQEALYNNPFPETAEPNRVFITFLDNEPDAAALELLSGTDFGSDDFKITEGVLYFHLPNGMAQSKMTNNFFEKKLKVTATGRNLNTVRKMIELAKR